MTTLLAVGDIHLGRLPVALPEDLLPVQRELGPEVAWQRAVDEAIAREVDGVLLAGDVVERSRDFFVAYGQLKAGVERLAEAGIPVLAVTGNHDTRVLPRLAAEIDHLELLGADGVWQGRRLGEVEIMGWSFPQPKVRSSPLADFPAADDDIIRIGLLHCDRDQADSPYAPVSSSELEAAPVSAWLLGHIHQPDALASNPSGYLGSINALRGSETGARGPWLIQAEGGEITAEHLALAPLRYEHLVVDVGDLEQPEDLSERLLEAAGTLVREQIDSEQAPDALGLRFELTGHSPVSSLLPDAAEEILDQARPWREAGISCFIHRIDVLTLPRLDLDSLARRSDPCGLLARRLITLADPDSPDRQELLDDARRRLEPLTRAREFSELERQLSDHEIAAHLQTAGHQALSRLMAQRERDE